MLKHCDNLRYNIVSKTVVGNKLDIMLDCIAAAWNLWDGSKYLMTQDVTKLYLDYKNGHLPYGKAWDM